MIVNPLHTTIDIHNVASITAKSLTSQKGHSCWLSLRIEDGAGNLLELTLFLRDGEFLRAGKLAQAINQAINETQPPTNQPVS